MFSVCRPVYLHSCARPLQADQHVSGAVPPGCWASTSAMQPATERSCSVEYSEKPQAAVHVRLSQQLKEELLQASVSGLRATLQFGKGSHPNVRSCPRLPHRPALGPPLSPAELGSACSSSFWMSCPPALHAALQLSTTRPGVPTHDGRLSVAAGHSRWRSRLRVHGARGEQLRPRQAARRVLSGRSCHGNWPHHAAPPRQGMRSQRPIHLQSIPCRAVCGTGSVLHTEKPSLAICGGVKCCWLPLSVE